MSIRNQISAAAMGVALLGVLAIPAGAQNVTGDGVRGQKLTDGQAYVTLVRLQHQANAADNGRVLITFEENGMKGLPIWESRDEGANWAYVTHATDPGPTDRCNLHWQPHLMEMPRTVGALTAGTLLLSGSQVCNDANGRMADMRLRLYKSTDAGRSWSRIGEIDTGTVSQPVWEPNLRLLDDGRLVTYYSSEKHKDQGFNQLLSYKVSSDGGQTWGPEIYNVAFPGGVERPGMAIVDRLADKSYVLSYESVAHPEVRDQVFFKRSKDGLDWGSAADRGVPVQADGGQYAASTPVISWFPVGGPKGVLVVSARNGHGGGDENGRSLFWNNNGGAGPWWEAPAPVQKRTNSRAGWTQALMLKKDGSFLHMTSSAHAEAPTNGSRNEILYASAPLNFNRYEAENAASKGANRMGDRAASNGRKIRLASGDIGTLRFRIYMPRAANYQLALNYEDIGSPGTPRMTANGRAVGGTAAPAPRDPSLDAVRNRDLGTRGTGQKMALSATVALREGENIIEVKGAASPLDVDFLEVTPAGG